MIDLKDKKVFVFDMDGTLINLEELHSRLFIEVTKSIQNQKAELITLEN